MLKTLTFTLLCASALAAQALPPALLPPVITSARVVRLQNATAGSKTMDDIRDRLKQWGRWEIVPTAAKADLMLILAEDAATANPRGVHLIVVDASTETPVLTVSCPKRITASRSSADSLVNQLIGRFPR